MKSATALWMASLSGALALAACSGDETASGGYAGKGDGAAGSAAGSGGSADDAAAGDAGSQADGGLEAGAASTWTLVYTNVISQRCSPCHTAPNGEGILNGKLDLATKDKSYANLVNVAAAGDACAGEGIRVVPGSAETSVLYQKLAPGLAAPCGAKMPLGAGGLSQEQADSIAAWIQAGALED